MVVIGKHNEQIDILNNIGAVKFQFSEKWIISILHI